MSAERVLMRDLVLVVLFVAFLFAGFADVVFDFDPMPSQATHQVNFPSVPKNLGDFAKFPAGAKRFLKSRSGFQESLLFAHATLKRDVLGVSPNRKVILGQDGWLFYNAEDSLDCFRNVYPMTIREKSLWVGLLQSQREHAELAGAKYLTMIAPNKHTIYPEFLPSWISQVRPGSRLDTLQSELISSDAQFPWIDLKATLLRGKKIDRVYHKTDTHWNSFGAHLAHQQILLALQDAFPEIDCNEPIRLEHQCLGRGGDLARLIGFKSTQLEDDIRPAIASVRQISLESGEPLMPEYVDIRWRDVTNTQCPTGEIDSAVIFHDSFGVILMPYLAQNFKKAVFVWKEYDPELVESVKPDVVIQEFVERRLMSKRFTR